MQRTRLGLLAPVALALLALLVASGASAEDAAFGDDKLDQLLAPIALYPDALLSQMLMAATYPLEVDQAVKWSAAHKDQDGDAAVEAVEGESWDPSVKSLVAFPQVLAMMSENPQWVQDVGDAFLAEPERAMDRIQFLRRKANEAGNLESNDKQKVSYQDDPAADEKRVEPDREIVQQQQPQTIIIEQANPQVIYVPTYNPTVIYGPWWWPRLTPWYWHPVGYGYGGAVMRGIGFGIGIGITNSLWGGFGWGRGNVNINVNKYNNINVNNRINSGDRNTNWKHNSDHRGGTPYRDKGTRDKYSGKREGGDRRDDFRGKDKNRDASRDRAQQTLADRGADPAKGREKLANDPKTRERAQQAAQGDAKARTGDRSARPSAQTADRSQARASKQHSERSRAQSSASRSRDSAFSGLGGGNTKQHMNRGNSSRSRAHSGGGGHRGGGGGGRRR